MTAKRNIDVNVNVNLNANLNICLALVTKVMYACTDITSQQNAIHVCPTSAFGRRGHKKKKDAIVHECASCIMHSVLCFFFHSWLDEMKKLENEFLNYLCKIRLYLTVFRLFL